MNIYSLISNIGFWIPFIILFWLSGYFSTRLRTSNEYVIVPVWLFYFCGAPKTEGVAKGLLTRAGASMQITALFQLVFAVFFDFLFKDENISGLVGLWSSLICSLVVTRLILRRTIL